jgi:hypothetical protein
MRLAPRHVVSVAALVPRFQRVQFTLEEATPQVESPTMSWYG